MEVKVREAVRRVNREEEEEKIKRRGEIERKICSGGSRKKEERRIRQWGAKRGERVKRK